MVCVASKLIQEVTEHAQNDSLEDAREICADSTYFPNNLCKLFSTPTMYEIKQLWEYVKCSW